VRRGGATHQVSTRRAANLHADSCDILGSERCPSIWPASPKKRLPDLNRRIVERLHFIRSAKQLTQLTRFTVGRTVEFSMEDGRVIRGSIARLNRQTATVVAPSGRWRLPPSLLRIVEAKHTSEAPLRIAPMPSGRRRA
jgi:hypothetical protein